MGDHFVYINMHLKTGSDAMLTNTWCFSCFRKECVVLYLGDVISECGPKN